MYVGTCQRFSTNKKTDKNRKLFVSLITSRCLAETYETRTTAIAQPERWQVVCYQNGVLTITGENQAMISQLAYLQKQYISQLSQINELTDLTKLQVCLRNPSQTPPVSATPERALNAETQELLRSAADFISDPKLSQALLRLASNKKVTSQSNVIN